MYWDYNKLKELIEKSDNIAILWHNNIDWDCIWASISFGSVLEKMWKKVSYFTEKKPSEIFNFIKWTEKFDIHFNWWNFDTIICIDFFDPEERFAWYKNVSKSYFDNKTKIVLDHHIKTSEFWDLYIWSDGLSSSCELIYDIINNLWPQYFDSDIATALLMWIMTDTGFYNFDKTLSTTFDVSSHLMKMWAKHQIIVNSLWRNNTLNCLKFYWILFERVVVKDWILYTYYLQQDLEKYWLDEDQAKSALSQLTSLKDIKVILFFRFIDNMLKCSVRTEKSYANQIAGLFGWWWHGKASWFRIVWFPYDVNSLDFIVTKVIDFIKNND